MVHQDSINRDTFYVDIKVSSQSFPLTSFIACETYANAYKLKIRESQPSDSVIQCRACRSRTPLLEGF